MSWFRQVLFGFLLYEFTCFYKEGGFESSLGSRLFYILTICFLLFYHYTFCCFAELKKELYQQRVIIHTILPEVEGKN